MSRTRTNQPAPANQLGVLVIVLLILIILVTGGLLSVTVRQEVGELARQNQQHEKAIARLEQRIASLRSEQARRLLPDPLREQALALGLRLVPASAESLVRMPPAYASDGYASGERPVGGELAWTGPERRAE